jgi:hypothetical protein
VSIARASLFFAPWIYSHLFISLLMYVPGRFGPPGGYRYRPIRNRQLVCSVLGPRGVTIISVMCSLMHIPISSCFHPALEIKARRILSECSDIYYPSVFLDYWYTIIYKNRDFLACDSTVLTRICFDVLFIIHAMCESRSPKVAMTHDPSESR